MSHRKSRGAGWRLDLVLVAALAGLAVAALLTPGVPWIVEWVLGLPFLLVAPGWALIALLLPGSPEGSEGSPTRADDGPGWVARVALTFPASVVVVATVAFVASSTVGIRLVPVVVGVGAATFVGLVGAWLHRRRLAPGRRATPLGGRVDSAPSAFGSTLQRVTFLLALVALVSAVALAGANPPSTEGYTEFYVLTETDDGDLEAADYPTGAADGPITLSLAIENDEGGPMTYDVVARAVSTGPGSETERVDRFQTSVPGGERVIAQRTFPSRTVGDGSRLEFLLYKGGAPAEPSAENAAMTLSVGGDGAEATGGAGATDGTEATNGTEATDGTGATDGTEATDGPGANGDPGTAGGDTGDATDTDAGVGTNDSTGTDTGVGAGE